MAKKKRSLNPNRFQQAGDQKFFSFDPVRQEIFKWGAIAGTAGGLLLAQEGFIWQILGFLAIFLISGRQIDKAAQRIPRWHAVAFSLLGTMPTMLVMVVVVRLILASLSGGASAS